jgi:hypothetical protein
MKIFWLVLVAMVPLTWGQTPDDIERVKLAYARLSFATQTFAVDDALSAEPNISYEKLVKAVAARTVTFEINVVSSGDIAKISNVPYLQFLAESFTGPAIYISRADAGATDGTVNLLERGAMAEWRPAPAETREWENLPFVEAMREGDSQLEYKSTAPTRYVLLKLTTKCGKRSITRNVIVLVGDGLMFVNPPTNQSTPAELATESLYPEVLLALSNPAVDRWFSENATQDETGHGDVICNLEALTCGVAAGDLRNEQRKRQQPH